MVRCGRRVLRCRMTVAFLLFPRVVEILVGVLIHVRGAPAGDASPHEPRESREGIHADPEGNY